MRVLTPTTLDEACALLAQPEAPVPMAGCTDLLVHWPDNLDAHERTYIDLTKVSALRAIHWTDDALTLGATTTYWDVVQDQRCRDTFPMLVHAARQVGAVQIQSRGTWGGNIVNASPAADGVPALMALDATVVLASESGRQEVPLSEFYLGYKEMRRRPDQLVEQIRIPLRAYDAQVFEKVGSRRAQAITKTGVAIAHSPAGWRVVANSMAPTVRRCPSVERMLDTASPVRSPDDLLPAIEADVSPIDDIRSTATYRKRVFSLVLYHALRTVCPCVQ